jgi:hypothetical protein
LVLFIFFDRLKNAKNEKYLENIFLMLKKNINFAFASRNRQDNKNDL